jgi:hypothetical protein
MTIRNRLRTVFVNARAFGVALGLVVYAGCGGTSDTPVCTASTTPQAATDFCAPASIASGQVLRLQLREQCGGCTQRATRCAVVVQGQEIKLQLLGETCTLPPGTACPAICSVNSVDCAVPALAAGTYRVSSAAGTSVVSTMVADPTVSATSCTLTGLP